MLTSYGAYPLSHRVPLIPWPKNDIKFNCLIYGIGIVPSRILATIWWIYHVVQDHCMRWQDYSLLVSFNGEVMRSENSSIMEGQKITCSPRMRGVRIQRPFNVLRLSMSTCVQMEATQTKPSSSTDSHWSSAPRWLNWSKQSSSKLAERGPKEMFGKCVVQVNCHNAVTSQDPFKTHAHTMCRR